MGQHPGDRLTADSRLTRDLFFWCPFHHDTATDVPPLPDIAIHEMLLRADRSNVHQRRIAFEKEY